jgi:DNA-directed RNA polymerase subunit K/omega
MNPSNINPSIISRNMADVMAPTGNVYKSISVIGKRARQIAVQHKEEISNKLSEFATGVDNLEEVHENREQIEISRQFERMPKPSTIAIEEFLDGKVQFRMPDIDEGK